MKHLLLLTISFLLVVAVTGQVKTPTPQSEYPGLPENIDMQSYDGDSLVGWSITDNNWNLISAIPTGVSFHAEEKKTASIYKRIDIPENFTGFMTIRVDIETGDLADKALILMNVHDKEDNLIGQQHIWREAPTANKKKKNYSLSLIGKNLTDESYVTTYSGDGFRYQIPRAADRYFGLNARFNF